MNRYNEAFADVPEIIVQKEIPESDTTRHLYIIQLDLEKLFDHKLSHCAPVHEEHWAQELTKDIKYCFTSKAIVQIADELNEYIERLGLRQ